jgi:amino acid adenylation domain-containing protein
MQSDKLLQKLINDYWYEKLANAAQPARRASAYNCAAVNTTVEADLLLDFSAITRQDRTGEYIFILSVYGILLHKYFGLDNFLAASPGFVFGKDAAKDNQPLFFNITAAADSTVKQVIGNTRDELEKVINYKNYDYGELRKDFAARAISEDDILQFSCSYPGLDGDNACQLNQAAFALSISKNSSNDLFAELRYNTANYDPLIAAQFLKHFRFLLTNIRSLLDTPLCQLKLVTGDDLHTIINEFNQPMAVPEHFRGITGIFEERVKQFPGHTAIKSGAVTYTYSQLNEKANQLAAYLVTEHKVKKDQLIGLVTGKTEWSIISILGILKAGAAFVPVEPAQPEERIRHIVSDAGIEVLLLESELMFDYGWFTGQLVVTDIQTDGFSYTDVQLPSGDDEGQLAYVIYTSGTTGKPKGVMINCSSVVNYANWVIEAFGVTEKDSSVVLASLAFDLGYTSVWGTLLAGGALHLVSYDYGTAPDKVLLYLAENNISFIKTTPSLFYMLTHVPAFKQNNAVLSLRLILLGGELIRKDDIELYETYYPGVQFVNHYGPTESTVGCIANLLTGNNITDPFTGAPIIGKPVKNCQAFIMEENGTLTPLGLEGEICIGGAGLARGYLNNTDLTAQKFIPHPFQEGQRLYKTGDFGRWTQDGHIIIHGRKDDQVKIRGHRIELGEIENQLLQHPFVEEAKVITTAAANSDKKIVAYYKTSAGTVNESDLRAFMAERVPQYMIPEYFTGIDRIPLTANGKIDLKKLPPPDLHSSGVKENHIPPRNEVEKLIVQVWQEVLGKTSLSMNDNFFDVGGNSLYLIKVSTMLSESFPDLTIVDLFNYTTIDKLSAFIAQKEDNTAIEVQGSSFTLQPQYFADEYDAEGEEKTDLRFQIKDYLLEELQQVAMQEEMPVTDLLTAIFAYSLYEIADGDMICIQNTAQVNGEVLLQPFHIDFSAIEGMHELFRTVREKKTAAVELQGIELSRSGNIQFTDKAVHSVVPLIYSRKLLQGKTVNTRVFDMILEIDDTNEQVLHCVFEYKLCFNPAMMESFIESFTDNLTFLVKSESLVSHN